MSKILITGRNGFLGSIINNYLIEQGKKTASLGLKDCDYNVDLSKEVNLLQDSFDLVIHAAGKAHSNPTNEKQRNEFYAVNLVGTQNLLNALDLSGFRGSFIFISTVSVYGLDEGIDIGETNLLNGNTPYAESKKKAEEYIINWGKQKGFKIGILRLPLIVGIDPPGNLGSMINGIKKGKYLGIINNNARKSMVNARDIVDALDPISAKGGIYNLTDGYHPKVSELESVISNSLNTRVKSIPMPIAKLVGKIGDVIGPTFPANSQTIKKLTSTLTFSDLKARQELGWNPTPVLDYISKILK